MNLIGDMIAHAYRVRHALARLSAPATHDPRADALARDGVLLMPGLISASKADEMNRTNARWFDMSRPSELVYSPDGVALLEAAGGDPERVDHFYFLHIKNFQRKFPVYEEIVPFVAPILRTYYGSHFFVRDLACYRTQAVPAVQGSYAWHRDNYPPGSLKVMVYLTDVLTPAHGPLTVAAGTQSGFVPQLGRVGDRYGTEAVAGRRLVDCLGPKGTVIIFDNNAIHRATDPVSGQRDVINFTVFPSIRPGKPGHVRGLDLDEEKTFLKRYTR